MDTNKDNSGTSEMDKATSKTASGSTVGAKSLTNSSSDNDNTATNSSSKKTTGVKKNSGMQAESQTGANKLSETEKGGALYKFFTDALKDMYFAEKHILEALPKMQKAATTAELQDAFEDHHLMTQKHISRLEKVFRIIGEEPEAKKCEAIIGIVKEGETCIKDTEEGTMTRDAGLIIAAQKVEHYEIATYGGLAALAETLELYDASDLLHTTMKEEKDTDDDLTHVAESFINFAAKENDENEEDYGDDDYEYEEENDDYEIYNRR